MTFLLLRTFGPNALRAKAYSTLRERFADAPLRETNILIQQRVEAPYAKLESRFGGMS
ncbi:hypothetical protein NIES3585_13580 [Nodularia sp. NIES-3585]|nr:hypothetical protein NIES3585_13580 [Nodularia sp. NIES-3585]